VRVIRIYGPAETTQSISVTTPGTYTVQVTNLQVAKRKIAGTTVTVNAAPATPTITASGSTTFAQAEV
jgi:hypothetical protein